MADQQGTDLNLPNPEETFRSMAEVAERSQRLVSEWLSRNGMVSPTGKWADPLGIGNRFFELTTRMMAYPAKVVQAQVSLWHSYMALWQNTTSHLLGQDTHPAGDAKERHFSSDAWEPNEVFDYVKQSFLLAHRWLNETTRNFPALDQRTIDQIEFFSQQFADAMSPRGFAFTNPEVLRTAIETGGENLIDGLKNILGTLERGMPLATGGVSSAAPFEVGQDVAATPGKVVFRNSIMELIQYAPTTDEVLRRPLLLVPEWINRFYLFDLRPETSWIRWAVGRGHTVFAISWAEPDGSEGARGFEDYTTDGVNAALAAIERATGERAVNAVGYAMGGAILAAAMAYDAARNEGRIASGTLLATLLDLSEPGEIGMLAQELSASFLDDRTSAVGGGDATRFASSFSLLRENDLIWSFVVNSYLTGSDAFPSDLVAWNADLPRIPEAMLRDYLHDIYQRNALSVPGGMTIAGEPIDLSKIKAPTYFLAAREDYIAPWRSVYAGTAFLSGPKRFTLTASGHVSGIVNPANGGRYGHWTSATLPPTADDWLAVARPREGSWWTDWDTWIKRRSGKDRVAARKPGSRKLKPLGDGPGTYIVVREQPLMS